MDCLYPSFKNPHLELQHNLETSKGISGVDKLYLHFNIAWYVSIECPFSTVFSVLFAWVVNGSQDVHSVEADR